TTSESASKAVRPKPVKKAIKFTLRAGPTNRRGSRAQTRTLIVEIYKKTKMALSESYTLSHLSFLSL
ncbi:MAG TPA: hypothetical protein VNK06_00240, partial [Thermodesulfobacteriota bacterium]|nr:hypothetical protein [Thermodesulfobacteriota bacterium]